MPLWLLYSLASSASYGFCNIFDKYLPNKIDIAVTTHFMLNAFMTLISMIVAITIWPLQPLAVEIMILATATGIIVGFSFFCYFQAAATLEAPVVSAFWQIGRVFAILIGYYVFDERFTLIQGFGIIIVILGSVLLSTDYKISRLLPKNSHHIAHGFYWMLGASLLLSIGNGFEKHLLFTISTPTIFFYGSLGYVLAGLCGFLFSSSSQTFKKDIKKIRPKTFGLLIIRKLCGSCGLIAVLFAFSVGPLSLVTASRALQSLIVFIYILILPKLGLTFVKQGHEKTYQKLPAMIMVILGVFLAAEVF